MDPITKLFLSEMYVAKLVNDDPVKSIKEKNLLNENFISSKIEEMVKNGLVNDDKKTISELGRSSLKIVLAGGVFDIIHPGHIHTLNAAKELGDVLVVVVATDKTAMKMKKRKPLHDQKLRKQLVNSLSVVDLCVIGNEDDIFKTVEFVKPEIIALGYDQVHQEKFITDGCKRINLDAKVARLQSPIPEISSSEIEKEYGEAIHDI